jgi:methyltransferase FkbM-like protein
LLKKFNIALVDAMKMDIEGAEFLALRGASQSLSEGKISRLIVELHDRRRKAEIEDLVKGFDFSFKWIDEDHIFASKSPPHP